MRTLVTGGAGFIGSHLCDALVERGDEVWCVDNLHLGKVRNIEHLRSRDGFHFLQADVLDRPAMDGLFAKAGFDAVFHLAANSDISRGNDDRTLDLRLTFQTTVEVLEAMLRHKVGKLFFASTFGHFRRYAATVERDVRPLATGFVLRRVEAGRRGLRFRFRAQL